MAQKIHQTWKKIFDINVLKADKHKWSLYPVSRVKQAFDLSNFSKKTAREVAKYLRENIKAQEKEIIFLKRWSPKVYHKNTYWSLQLENRAMATILKRLEKLLK